MKVQGVGRSLQYNKEHKLPLVCLRKVNQISEKFKIFARKLRISKLITWPETSRET